MNKGDELKKQNVNTKLRLPLQPQDIFFFFLKTAFNRQRNTRKIDSEHTFPWLPHDKKTLVKLAHRLHNFSKHRRLK